jgi:hypothetical protein
MPPCPRLLPGVCQALGQRHAQSVSVMKIIDIPQTGKLGLTVSYKGRTGLIRRSLVVPKNPRTPDQTIIRTNLASQARARRSRSLTPCPRTRSKSPTPPARSP